MNEVAGRRVGERLLALLDHLGISRAHFLSRSPLDVLDLVALAPERIASIVIQGAEGRPEEFGPLRRRTLWLLGDEGRTARLMSQRLASETDPHIHWIRGYPEFNWSNTAADRGDEVAAAVLEFLARIEQTNPPPAVSLSGAGEVGGVTYRAAGSGTPVVVLPLGLSSRQWEPVLPAIRQRHCTVVLGGRHVQPVENLESRGAGDYSRMALQLLDMVEPRPHESLIEVGCGSGALLRRIARHTGMERVTGLDVNPFLLGEARAIATQEGLMERLDLHEGSAEAIPFPEDSFDIAFSSTVMEEVDAERMLAEMTRITRPGGRVAVIVRAVDRGPWTNLPLPDPVREKVEAYSGAVGDRGCADASLCGRLHEAGLRQVRGGPAWAWLQPSDPWWENALRQINPSLSAEEDAIWRSALASAQADGLPVWIARPFHCAIGVK